MYPQKKKKIKLLFLRNYHQIIEKTPNETQFLVPERHVSKSFLSRSLKENSLYQSFSMKKKKLSNFHNKTNLFNKNKEVESFSPENRYKNIFRKEKPIKFQYLNNNILDELFSINLKTSELEKTITTNLNDDFSKTFHLKTKKYNVRNKLKSSKSLPKKNKTIDEKKLNEINKYNIFNKLLNNDKKKTIENIQINKYSLAGKLILKMTNKLDVIEEHGNLAMKPQNKFVKFKLLLNNQRNKILNLIRDVNNDRIKNENILRGYLQKLRKKIH